jgi:hypothetical protein
MGQAEKTARAELTEHPDCQHRAAKIRQPRQDKKERTAENTGRTGHLDRTDRSIQPEWDNQNRTSRTGQADRGDRTGLLASTVKTVLLGQDVYCRTDKTG